MDLASAGSSATVTACSLRIITGHQQQHWPMIISKHAGNPKLLNPNHAIQFSKKLLIFTKSWVGPVAHGFQLGETKPCLFCVLFQSSLSASIPEGS
ncbi:unnamed protein product [Caenorhabditis nigoni]